MIKRYTTAQLDFLRKGYKKMRLPELTAAFNKKYGMSKPVSSIRAATRNHKMLSGRVPGFKVGENLMFDNEQVAFIKREYKSNRREALTKLFNEKFGLSIEVSQMVSFCKNHKITCGRKGYFEKGEKPWNTGTKGLMKANSGTFKKGDVPATIKPVGSERICTKDGYVLIKVAEPNPYTGAPTRYRAKHQVVWEKHNEKIPKGMLVTFLDGDKLNCDIENLELISLSENLHRNQLGLNKAPKELRPTIRALAKLEAGRFKKINEQRN